MKESLKQIASRLGLELVDESEDTEKCLNDLDRCGAKIGPFTSWFYEARQTASRRPVPFRKNVLISCRRKHQYSIKRIFDWYRFLMMPSKAIPFYAAPSKDGKKEVWITLGHELVSLNQDDQQVLMDYKTDDTDYILPQNLAEIVLGVNHNGVIKWANLSGITQSK